jgi:hypothetical protein
MDGEMVLEVGAEAEDGMGTVTDPVIGVVSAVVARLVMLSDICYVAQCKLRSATDAER